MVIQQTNSREMEEDSFEGCRNRESESGLDRLNSFVNQALSISVLRCYLLVYWIVCLYSLISKDLNEKVRIIQLITGIIAVSAGTFAIACKMPGCLYPIFIDSLFRFFYFLFLFCYICAKLTFSKQYQGMKPALSLFDSTIIRSDSPIIQFLNLLHLSLYIIFYEVVSITVYCCIPLLRSEQNLRQHHNNNNPNNFPERALTNRNADRPPAYSKLITQPMQNMIPDYPPPDYNDLYVCIS